MVFQGGVIEFQKRSKHFWERFRDVSGSFIGIPWGFTVCSKGFQRVSGHYSEFQGILGLPGSIRYIPRALKRLKGRFKEFNECFRDSLGSQRCYRDAPGDFRDVSGGFSNFQEHPKDFQ